MELQQDQMWPWLLRSVIVQGFKLLKNTTLYGLKARQGYIGSMYSKNCARFLMKLVWNGAHHRQKRKQLSFLMIALYFEIKHSR